MRSWLKAKTLSLKSYILTKLGGLRKYLRNPALWEFDCHAVALGVAIGVFAAFVPILPFQMVIAAIIAILIRANLPMAVIASWISNPITFLPITYLTYFVGNWVLGIKNSKIILLQYSWKYDSTYEFLAFFSHWFLQFGKAFFIGLLIVSLSAAILSYLIVTLIWYSSLFIKKYIIKKHTK